MTNHFDSTSDGSGSGAIGQGEGFQKREAREAPHGLLVLPDGRESVVIGNLEQCDAIDQYRGKNSYGFAETCNLAACADILRQYGAKLIESDVVQYAHDHYLLCVGSVPEESGGVTIEVAAHLLNVFGLPSHAESAGTLEVLASRIEDGRGAIITVNAGELWNDSNYLEGGEFNHAVVVTGVARNPSTAEILGFFINDSGVPPRGESCKFIEASTTRRMWHATGGEMIVVDVVHP